jgi:sugar-specific transcriptional regulator TrmB
MKTPMGQYCEVYGNTIQNRVIEYFLEFNTRDVAIGDMAKEIGISRPKAYQIIEELQKKKYIITDRIIGRTQLYKLNKENPIVKIFIRNFNECLQMVVNEHRSKKNNAATARVPISVKTI